MHTKSLSSIVAVLAVSLFAFQPGCVTAGIDESDGVDPSQDEISGSGAVDGDLATAQQALEPEDVSNGVYQLRVKHSNMCLDVWSTAAGVPAVQKTCNGNPTQKFILTLESDGKYKIQSNADTNLCLHMGGAGMDNGVSAVLWYCQQPRPTHQKFTVGAKDGQGYVCITAEHSKRPLSIVGSSMFEGAALYQYGAPGSCSNDTQKFLISPP